MAQEGSIEEILYDVCTLLRKHEARVNKTCGLHVHLDVRAKLLNGEHQRIYERLVKAQNLLFSVVPPTRRTNHYCKKSTMSRGLSDRYRAINRTAISKYKTIEVRLHSGSTNAKKIWLWVALLCRIANCQELDKMNKAGSNVKTWAKRLGMGDAEKSYWLERQELFNGSADVGEVASEIEMGEDSPNYSPIVAVNPLVQEEPISERLVCDGACYECDAVDCSERAVPNEDDEVGNV